MPPAKRGVYRVHVLESAIADVRDMVEYIARHSIQNAQIVEDRAIREIASLRVLPRRGRRAVESDDLGIELRQITKPPMRILYRIVDRDVFIVAVLHVARDRWPGPASR